MTTQLADFIANAPVIDTHEHMRFEHDWLENGPHDVLADLFANYVSADLAIGGASLDAIKRLSDREDHDVEGRWSGIEKAWHAIEHTGYGQAVSLIAKHVYQIDEISPQALRAAQPKLQALRQPGQRLHILRDLAKLDHIQTDNGRRVIEPDDSGPDFFFYDISWVGMVYRGVDWTLLESETGVAVKDLKTLRQAMEAIFERYGPYAIAVKTQHAYNRTLRWEKRKDADAERALQAMLKSIDNVDEATRLCFGDWCLAQGAQLAGEYNLPVKIHTGYYAGNDNMITDRIRAGHLCPLIIAHPDTRFVLMHIAYPYSDELIAMAKHFTNVWADLCWAWSISPAASTHFVQQFIHTAPANKLFAFGGDINWPTSAYAYSIQMRKYLTKALQAQVDDDELTEQQAIDFAQRVMFDNQMACFDVDATREANVKAMAVSQTT